MSTSDLITVGVAALAAALSATNLLVTTRRDEKRWRRDSLVDTIVQFTDGSFKLPGNRAYRLLLAGGDLTEVRRSAAQGFAECETALTRLRILAPNKLVEKAEELHGLDDWITEQLLSSDVPPSRDEWIRIADKRMLARTALLDAARDGLGLKPARPFQPTRHRLALALGEEPQS